MLNVGLPGALCKELSLVSFSWNDLLREIQMYVQSNPVNLRALMKYNKYSNELKIWYCLFDNVQ